MGEQPLNAGILDFATHEGVRRDMSPYRPVSSYLAFSPYTARGQR